MTAEPFVFLPPLSRAGIAARVAEYWRLWRQRRRWLAEMRNAAALGRLDEVLGDVGITRADLDYLAAAPADAGRQFEELAAIEHGDLRMLAPRVRREAGWTCLRCGSRAACKRWLHSGVWQRDGDPRCPNAALLRR